MAVPQVTPDADGPALPPELRGPRPLPLPPWARRGPGLELSIAALGVAFSLFLLLWTRLTPWLQVAPLGFVAVGAGQLWYRARMRELLRFGTPHAARMERLRAGGEGGLEVEYSMGPGPHARGRLPAHGLPRASAWPQPGDTVVLLAWGKRVPSRVVWGFVPRPGRAPGPVPRIYRPVSGWTIAQAVAATILVLAVMTWLTCRR